VKPAGDSPRTPFALIGAAAALCLGACADIWGFRDLGVSSDGGLSAGGGVIASGGGAGEGGSRGTPAPIPDGGSGGQPGSDGSAAGTGGVAATGVGGMQADADMSDRQESGEQAGSADASDSGHDADADRGPEAAGQEGGDARSLSDAACVAVTRDLITNGAFEQGETGWTVFVAGGFPIVYAANGNGESGTPDIAAQSPPNLTWIGGYNRGDDSITQNIALPASATSMTLVFYYAIVTRETGTTENDVMDVQIMAGAQTVSLAHFSNLDPVGTWTRFSMALPSSLAGQNVTLQFHGTTNANAISSFYVDTVSLQVVACP
jgi:hypothetical protein